MKSVQDWLAMPEDKLGVELAKVLTPGPWKHNTQIQRTGQVQCIKCCLFAYYWHGKYVMEDKSEHCPVPDPIDINDWNVAMEWRDKMLSDANCEDDQFRFLGKMEAVALAIMGMWRDGDGQLCFDHWLIWKAQPKHYLIAAASAAGRTEG